MSHRVFEMVDQLPLAGKFSIRESIKSYSEVSEPQEKHQFIATQKFLLWMVAGHALQTYMGYDALNTHLPDVLSNEADPLTYAATAVDAVYIAVNGLVTARQANLMTRVGEMRKKKQKRWSSLKQAASPDTDDNPRQKAPERSPAKENKRKELAALAITLAGQFAFLGSYTDAKIQTCEEANSQYYVEYTAAHPDELFIPESEYVEEKCDP